MNIQTGSSGVNVYDGAVAVTGPSGGLTAESGQALSCISDTLSALPLSASSLNAFNIAQAKAANGSRSLCFSKSDLEAIEKARQEEIDRAQEEKEAQDAAIIAQGGTQAVVSTSSESGGQAASPDTQVYTCTIQIRCDTILDNMAHLTAGKDRYVPANGVILAASSVQFVEGETVFDVLRRACDYAGIQLEYSWTPMYGSYYIEGINNLYEFDCGNESGWMYKVNGWFPNYGCSSYTLETGDVIVWCYTCNGLGADVGGSVY